MAVQFRGQLGHICPSNRTKSSSATCLYETAIIETPFWTNELEIWTRICSLGSWNKNNMCYYKFYLFIIFKYEILYNKKKCIIIFVETCWWNIGISFPLVLLGVKVHGSSIGANKGTCKGNFDVDRNMLHRSCTWGWIDTSPTSVIKTTTSYDVNTRVEGTSFTFFKHGITLSTGYSGMFRSRVIAHVIFHFTLCRVRCPVKMFESRGRR